MDVTDIIVAKRFQQSYAWEASYNRSWDAVQEDESGGLQAAVEGLMMRGRRRRSVPSLHCVPAGYSVYPPHTILMCILYRCGDQSTDITELAKTVYHPAYVHPARPEYQHE